MAVSISADPDHLAGKMPEKTDQKTRNNLDMPYTENAKQQKKVNFLTIEIFQKQFLIIFTEHS